MDRRSRKILEQVLGAAEERRQQFRDESMHIIQQVADYPGASSQDTPKGGTDGDASGEVHTLGVGGLSPYGEPESTDPATIHSTDRRWCQVLGRVV